MPKHNTNDANGCDSSMSFEGLVLDDIDCSHNLNTSSLYVPWDNLDDIEFCPCFSDEPIPKSEVDYSYSDIQSMQKSDYNAVEKLGLHGTVSIELTKVGLRRKPRSKQPKRKPNRSFFTGLKVARKKCAHCTAEKTPQWRTGPMGPKTLCNACGMRYKMGKLLAEYRPIASPSFDSSKHSNYHRKIMGSKNL